VSKWNTDDLGQVNEQQIVDSEELVSVCNKQSAAAMYEIEVNGVKH